MPVYILTSSPTLEEGPGTRRVRFEAEDDAAAIDFARGAPDDMLVSSPARVAVQAEDGFPLWSRGRQGFSWAR
jgi:hypothetical protein